MIAKRIVSVALACLMGVGVLTSCARGGEIEIPFAVDERSIVYSAEAEGAAMTLYVDAAAAEGGDGSAALPFNTISGAQEKIRALKAENALPVGGVRVLVKDGSYGAVTFEETDSGTAESPVYYVAENRGGAVISGGIVLDPADFEPLCAAEKARIIDEEARDNIMKIDLKKYGLTAEEWGEVCPAGGLGSMVGYYDEYPTNISCEVAYNGKAMILARYPNKEQVYTVGVLSHGDCGEWGPLNCLYDQGGSAHHYNYNLYEGYEPSRNPEAGIVVMDDETAARVAMWQDLDDIWTFGLGKFSWARHQNKVKEFDLEQKSLALQYSTYYGLARECPYYIYNVFEELDMSGEFYIDREQGILYLYADNFFDTAEITVSYSKENIITGSNVSYITLKGLGAMCTKMNGIVITGGDYITIDSCDVYNVRGVGVNINGMNCTVYNCEIYNTGNSAILISGGDIDTLTKSNNVVCNNYLHNFGYTETSKGLDSRGCGTLICHNEICNSYHQGASFYTLDVFEYNELYNLCTETADSGAIYIFGDRNQIVKWAAGTVARYNFIHEIGNFSEENNAGANGIYYDGPTSGWTAYGNIIANVTGYGIMNGGGRDYVAENNVFINCMGAGFNNNGSMVDVYYHERDFNNDELEYVTSYQEIQKNEIWMKEFPYLAAIITDFSCEAEIRPEDVKSKNLMINSYGVIRNNISYYGKQKMLPYQEAINLYWGIEDIVEAENNYVVYYRATDFNGYHNDDYSFKDVAAVYELLPEFEEIPFEEIGRKK